MFNANGIYWITVDEMAIQTIYNKHISDIIIFASSVIKVLRCNSTRASEAFLLWNSVEKGNTI